MMSKDEHGQEPTQSIPAKDGDLEVPIPSRDDFLSVVEKVARPPKPFERKSPKNP